MAHHHLLRFWAESKGKVSTFFTWLEYWKKDEYAKKSITTFCTWSECERNYCIFRLSRVLEKGSRCALGLGCGENGLSPLEKANSSFFCLIEVRKISSPRIWLDSSMGIGRAMTTFCTWIVEYGEKDHDDILHLIGVWKKVPSRQFALD